MHNIKQHINDLGGKDGGGWWRDCSEGQVGVAQMGYAGHSLHTLNE